MAWRCAANVTIEAWLSELLSPSASLICFSWPRQLPTPARICSSCWLALAASAAAPTAPPPPAPPSAASPAAPLARRASSIAAAASRGSRSLHSSDSAGRMLRGMSAYAITSARRTSRNSTCSGAAGGRGWMQGGVDVGAGKNARQDKTSAVSHLQELNLQFKVV